MEDQERKIWFKFYGMDWITDDRIQSMQIEDRLCYITLLCLASQNNGIVTEPETLVLRLTNLYNDPIETDNEFTRAEGVIKRLESNGAVTLKGREIVVNAWEKRQNRYLTNAERQKRFREKGKKSYENNGIDKIRLDKNRITNTGNEVAGKDINEILGLFKEVNPMYEEFFKNKTERKAVEDMIKRIGVEKLRSTMEHLPQIINKKYAPKITKPTELKRDFGKLVTFYNQENGVKKKIIL